MNCPIIQMQMLEYLKGDLDPETRGTITSHLDSCVACKEEYEMTKLILSFSKRERSETPPEGYWVSLLPRIRTKIDAQVFPSTDGFIQRYLVPVAAAIVLIIFCLRIGDIGLFSNQENTQFILQQVPETELQEYLQKQSIVGIHEANYQTGEAILTSDDGVVVSDLIAGESSITGYVDEDPVLMYETISNQTANEIVTIIASNNL
jgi:hypothetical protein